MNTLKIEIKNKKCFIDNRLWGKVWGNTNLLGDYILNVLFYNNKDGKNEIKLFINDIDETEDFKKQVKEKYQNINNTELRDNFFKYAKIN